MNIPHPSLEGTRLLAEASTENIVKALEQLRNRSRNRQNLYDAMNRLCSALEAESENDARFLALVRAEAERRGVSVTVPSPSPKA